MILPSLLSLCLVLFCLTDSVKLKKRAADLFSAWLLCSILSINRAQQSAVFTALKLFSYQKKGFLQDRSFSFVIFLNHFHFYLCKHTGTFLDGEWRAAGGDTACCGTVMESSISRTTPWQASWGHFGGHGEHWKRLICFLKVSSNIPSTTDIYICWFVYICHHILLYSYSYKHT